MESPTDAELMARARRGEQEAFRTIYDRHHQAVYRFCARMTGDPEEAADLMQETFLRAFAAAGRFEARARVTTWLFTIARNLCLNHTGRADRRNPARAAGRETVPDPELLPAREKDPERAALERERSRAVREAVLALPESLRVPVILSRFHGLPHAEIAAVLGCSVTAVKLRLHRAGGILRKALGGYAKAEGTG